MGYLLRSVLPIILRLLRPLHGHLLLPLKGVLIRLSRMFSVPLGQYFGSVFYFSRSIVEGFV